MNNIDSLSIQLLSPNAIIPSRAFPTDAGLDLYNAEESNIILNPGERHLFKTDIAVAIPEGYYGRVAPRSGLALKNGLDVMAGVIDSQYRGNVGIVLVNLGQEPVRVSRGSKIAQLIIEKCALLKPVVAETLPESDRGAGGYGSSGA